MRYSLTLVLLIVFSRGLSAQDMKLLDYAPLYQKLKVKGRNCSELRYKGDKVSSTLQLGQAEFDTQGKLVKYTEFFAGGKKMAEYIYTYNAKGKLEKNTVALVFNNWEVVDLNLSFDAKGKLISRELPLTVSNFWQKETFTYSPQGVMIKSEQWYMNGGKLVPQTKQDYPASLTSKENSLSLIHDEKGLLIIKQFFGAGGKVDKSWKYEYVYY
jgi:hypothetical protein